MTEHFVFLGTLGDFRVFLEQRLQCHPQAKVGNAFVGGKEANVVFVYLKNVKVRIVKYKRTNLYVYIYIFFFYLLCI